MIALDTNVLVRFLVEDDRKQAARARALISRSAAAGIQLFVSDIVFCEIVWVLDSAYGFGREEIAAVLAQLLQTRQLTFQSSDRIAEALGAYGVGHGDFADYVIREEAMEAGCEVVVTFDKALLHEAGFRAP
jgi:predicted nucleic-acid-binding protein